MNIWKQLQERKKLIKAFKKSGLYLGNEQNYIFPKIHSISTEQITFTLPTGLDPSLIKKNFYVFKQIYGEHVEIKGMTKTFTFNSRIIGTPGSEKIKDVGKFLLKIPLSDEPIEVLAPFLPLEQAKHILTSYKSDTGKTSNLSRIDFKKSVIDLQEFTKDVFGVLDE